MITISFHRNPLIRIAEEESLDYFYRMGGCNCYPGYDNWHALALVLVVCFEKRLLEQVPGENCLSWISWDMVDGCQDLIDRLRTKIVDEEVDVPEYIEWADKFVIEGLYAEPSRFPEWQEFKARLFEVVELVSK